MKRRVATVAAAVALLMLPAACRTERDQMEWRLPLTEAFTMRSSALAGDFEIMVALPRGYAGSTATYPVLYVLDANGMFPIAVETARFLSFDPLKVDPVIVGIGYPAEPFWNTLGQRIRDFIPTQDAQRIAFEQRASQPRHTNQLTSLSDATLPAVARALAPRVPASCKRCL